MLIPKSKSGKLVNYIGSGLVLAYLGLIIYPNVLFAHSVRYKQFNIHSTQSIGSEIYAILDQANDRLSASEVADKSTRHKIYLCNDYRLFTFLAPFSRTAFACNYAVLGNIFIAKADISLNEAYKNNDADQYTRSLSGLITHESTHSLIRKKIGLLNYSRLSTWKDEGYCDYISHGKLMDMQEAREYLKEHKTDKRPGTDYRRYYLAVNYLLGVKNIRFDDLLATKQSFDEVLRLLETEQ